MIKNNPYLEDFRLAQKICKELLNQNKKAIQELFYRFQKMFVGLARKRLYNKDPNQAESILSNFWIELLNANAICDYKAKASLKSYLIIILSRRIIDDNRSYLRENSKKDYIEDNDIETLEDKDSTPSPEDKIIDEDKKRIINEALLMLGNISPKDADLIRMHIQGLDYKQMAEMQFAISQSNEQELKKKVDSLKKQFTRKRTGSLAKFKICLNKCLEKHKLSYRELFV